MGAVDGGPVVTPPTGPKPVWKERKEGRYALRVEVGGRLVAAHLPPEYHGRDGTYVNHGCRCTDCTNGHARSALERDQQRRIRREMAEYRRNR